MVESSKISGEPRSGSLREYIESVDRIRAQGLWRLPIGMIGHVQIFLLRFFARFSWFSGLFRRFDSDGISLAYKILLDYVYKRHFFDSIGIRRLRCQGYYGYFFLKKIQLKDRSLMLRCQGVGETREEAISIALGEVIERMVSGMYDMNKEVLIASPEEMFQKGLPVVYPPRHHRFLDVQMKRFKELVPDMGYPVAWVQGMNLVNRQKTYLLQNVTSWYSRAWPENRKGPVVVHATTNGAAGYFTRKGAVLRGLLEVVQRDAFLVHWLTMVQPDVVDRTTLPDSLKEKIAMFESLGISILLLDTTAIPIPSVLVVGIKESEGVSGVVLTAASDITFQRASMAALKEMVAGIKMFDRVDTAEEVEFGRIEFEPFVSDLDRIGRQLYWKSLERVEKFRWFVSGKSISYAEAIRHDIDCTSDDGSRLKVCLGILEMLGDEYYPVVYYPKNSIQEKLGFFVAQVYIPKAFPLYLFEKYGTFDSDRLTEFATLKGKPDWYLNPLPHGFP